MSGYHEAFERAADQRAPHRTHISIGDVRVDIDVAGDALAERLLAVDPTYYDAYLAVGVENYLLSLKPAPMRWVLGWTGAQTDRETGLARLRITADKGHYLLPYARLLLAVAAPLMR